MRIFKKEYTESTPEVYLNFDMKKLSIKGVCSPENPISFFNEIKDNLDAFIAENNEMELDFTFDYFNTGSSKCILNLLFIIKSKTDNNFNCKINWFLIGDDSEMRESGYFFEELTGLKFNYLETN
jgi:hypothetical protein